MISVSNVFDQIYRKMEVGVLVLDSELNILFWNDWLVNYTGILERDASQKKLTELYPDLSDEKIKLLKQTLTSDQSHIIPAGCDTFLIPVLFENSKKEKRRYIPQRIELIPVINELGHKWLAAIIHNASEPDSNPEDFNAERNKVVMEMAKALAHKINQPLQGILSYAELLELENHQAENPTLAKITQCAEQIRDIIHQVQQLEKYESQAYVRDIRIVNLDKT